MSSVVEWIFWAATAANVVMTVLNWRLLRRAYQLNAAVYAMALEHHRVLRFLAWPAARYVERRFASQIGS